MTAALTTDMAYTGTGKALWAQPSEDKPFIPLWKAFVLAVIVESVMFGAMMAAKHAAAALPPKHPPMKVVKVEPPPPPPPPPKVEEPPKPPEPKPVPVKEKLVEKPQVAKPKAPDKQPEVAPVALEAPKDVGPAPAANTGVSIPTAVGEKTTAGTGGTGDKVSKPAEVGSFWVNKPKIHMPRAVMSEVDEDTKCTINEMEVEANQDGKILNARYVGKNECPQIILDEIRKQLVRNGQLNPSPNALRKVSVPMEFKLNAE